jgi:hypothetical protein
VRLLGGVWSEGGAVIRREEIIHAVWFKSAERNHFCIGKNDRLHPLVFCSANAKSSIHAAPPTRPAQSCSASDMRHPEAALPSTGAATSRSVPDARRHEPLHPHRSVHDLLLADGSGGGWRALSRRASARHSLSSVAPRCVRKGAGQQQGAAATCSSMCEAFGTLKYCYKVLSGVGEWLRSYFPNKTQNWRRSAPGSKCEAK